MPRDIDLVRQWILKAQAEATLGEGIGFHCQQAVEKSLKAFLVPGDIRQAFAIAEQVFTFVLERLPPQAHPA